MVRHSPAAARSPGASDEAATGRTAKSRTRSSPRTTILAWALAAAVVSCGTDEPEPPGELLLVGDSLFFQAAGELRRALEHDGWIVTISAHPGAGLAGGGYSGVDWDNRLEQVLRSVEPEVTVVELGTNGCGADCASIPGAIEDVMSHLTDVPLVLWLNVRTDAPRPDGAESINEALRRAAEERDNLDLLPYDQWFEGRPDLLRPDGIHLTPAGQRVMAERVQRAVRARVEQVTAQ